MSEVRPSKLKLEGKRKDAEKFCVAKHYNELRKDIRRAVYTNTTLDENSEYKSLFILLYFLELFCNLEL